LKQKFERLLSLNFFQNKLADELDEEFENNITKEQENINNKIIPIPDASSFFIFSKDNKFRKLCHFVANYRWFGNAVLICILISSCMLAAEDPVRPHAYINEVCDLEKILKIQKKIIFYYCFK